MKETDPLLLWTVVIAVLAAIGILVSILLGRELAKAVRESKRSGQPSRSLIGTAWEKATRWLRGKPPPKPPGPFSKYMSILAGRITRLALEGIVSPGREVALHIKDVFVAPNLLIGMPPLDLDKPPQEGAPDEKLRAELKRGEAERRWLDYNKGQPIQLWNVVGDAVRKRLVIVGHVGSGKSTLARFLALSLASEDDGDPDVRKRIGDSLPLLVELKHYAPLIRESRCSNFIEYFDYLGNTEFLGITGGEIQSCLANGRPAVLIFDGLDEVFDSQLREKIMREIVGIADTFPNVKVLVTSRIVGYRSGILQERGFEHYTLQDFTQEQIEQFTEKWYMATLKDIPEREQRRDRITKAVRESESVRMLAGRPMLLTILANMGRFEEIPRERHKLYHEAACVLADRWDRERNLLDALELPYRQLFRVTELMDLLGSAASFMYERGGGQRGNWITVAELEKVFCDFVYGRWSFDPALQTTIARALTNRFENRSCILCHYGGGIYGFVHRAFLEYFCAYWHLKESRKRMGSLNCNEYEALKPLIDAHMLDPNWQEPIRLMCGMAGDETGMLIAQHIDEKFPWPPYYSPPPWNYRLALKCMAECYNPGSSPEIADYLVRDRLETLLNQYPEILPDSDGGFPELEQVISLVSRTAGRWNPRDLLTAWTSGNNPILYHERYAARLYGTVVVARLCRMTAGAFPALKKIVCADQDWRVRRRAIQELVLTWSDHAELTDLLEDRVLTDDQDEVKACALRSLVEILNGAPGEHLLTLALQWARQNKHPMTRDVAIRLLRERWPDDPRVRKLLK